MRHVCVAAPHHVAQSEKTQNPNCATVTAAAATPHDATVACPPSLAGACAVLVPQLVARTSHFRVAPTAAAEHRLEMPFSDWGAAPMCGTNACAPRCGALICCRARSVATSAAFSLSLSLSHSSSGTGTGLAGSPSLLQAAAVSLSLSRLRSCCCSLLQCGQCSLPLLHYILTIYSVYICVHPPTSPSGSTSCGAWLWLLPWRWHYIKYLFAIHQSNHCTPYNTLRPPAVLFPYHSFSSPAASLNCTNLIPLCPPWHAPVCLVYH